MAHKLTRLRDLLLSMKLVTREELATAEQMQRETPAPIGSILVSLGYMTEERLLGATAAQMGVSPWHLGDQPPQPEAIVEQNTEIALVERALLQLPMHLRAAATLRFIEGRSHPEIAEILNQPIGTVKSHVHRAVRILRRILGPQIGRFAPEGVPLHALS